MSTKYSHHISPQHTPQTESVLGKDMVANLGGGYSFAVDHWKRLDRFLILGCQGGSYYATERKMTQENAACVIACASIDAQRVVNRIVEVSVKGLAPKNDPAIFALAMVASMPVAKHQVNPNVSQIAIDAMPQVCRIGTHLFQFVETVNELRGWGRGLQRGIRRWYDEKTPEQMAHQVLKYQQRDGWSHRDVMHLCHLRSTGLSKDVQHWAERGWDDIGDEPHPEKALQQIWAFERLKREPKNEKLALQYIRDYQLTREMVPTECLNSPDVWTALLDKMPMTAMIRNLATMTRVGILGPLSWGAREVKRKLADVDQMRKARVHPLSILVALKIYARGEGEKGSNHWEPNQQVVDLLDEAFYSAFDAVEPTGKRWMLSIDVSASMGADVSASMGAAISGMPLSCCEAATALALVTSRTEPESHINRFNNGLEGVRFGNKTRLDEALTYTRNINGGGTDCALPMIIAAHNRIPVDVFVVITDSETYAGRIHPFKAVQQYRERMGINAKVIVMGMTSNGFSVADPSDPNMLDIAGMSTDVPQAMRAFAME